MKLLAGRRTVTLARSPGTWEGLGRSTLVAHETVLLLGPTFSTGIISRSGTYTAANGDVLNFTFSGTATISATGVLFEGTET